MIGPRFPSASSKHPLEEQHDERRIELPLQQLWTHLRLSARQPRTQHMLLRNEVLVRALQLP